MSSKTQNMKEGNETDENIKPPGKPILQKAQKSIKHDISTIKVEQPQFVPYEPYKAAVNPIIKNKNNAKVPAEILTETAIPFPLNCSSPSGYSISDRSTSPKSPLPLIRVNRRVRTYSGHVLDNSDVSASAEVCDDATCSWTDEKVKLQNEIMQLKNDKHIIEGQLQTQTQVNAELKKLLVASVGEDIQQKVQFLTEDKARLAEDIVGYSQRLITDYEEMEKLSIQCDVWRSKYLASSVMVDELAKWKALLSRKFEESKQVMEMVMTEHKTLRNNISKTNRNLQNLLKSFDPTLNLDSKGKRSCDLNSFNILQIGAFNLKMSEELMHKLLGNNQTKANVNSNSNITVTARTQAEEFTYQVLSNSYHMNHNEVSDLIDFPSGNLIGSAAKYLDSNMYCNSCSHCCGEIKQI